MESHSLIILLIAVLVAQQCRACAPNCASLTTNRVVNETIDRVVVSGVEEAQWRGMCHSLCITAVDTEPMNAATLPSWPAVLEVDTKCNKISNYLRCVEGCVSRRFQSPSLTNNQCQDDCSSRCDATCFGLDCEVSSTCQLRCQGGGCKTGCSDSRHLMVSNDKSPAAPNGSDIILVSASNGFFLLDVHNTQPSNDNVSSSSIHSFVVRIESDDITKYWWMGNFEEAELDLNEFVCKEVNISFAVINEHGISDFSHKRRFCLKGAQTPGVNVTFKEIAEDPRHPGLFTVNVTWTHPSDVIPEEVQYRVIITGSCDKTVEITTNTTSVSEPGFAPRCRLTVRVYTLLMNDNIESVPNITRVTLEYTDQTTVRVNHTMEPNLYSGNYNLTIYISLLTDDPLLVASILSIRVSNHKQVGMFPEDFIREDIHPAENTFDYSISFIFTPMDRNEVTVIYTVSAQQAFNLRYRGRFIFPGSKSVVYRGLPPSTINSLDIVNGTVDVVTSTIQLNITWEPPYPYGEFEYYELRLTAEVNGTDSYPSGGERLNSVNDTFNVLNATISLKVETYSLELFSKNKIGISQSTFYNFSLSDYYDNTTEVVLTDQPVMSQHSEDTTTPVYAYYIIGIGSAVLLIGLTLAVCCCAYTCYVRWINAKELPPMPVSMKGPWGLYSEKGFYREPSIIISDGPPIVSDAWEINPDRILLGKELGSGFFGEVYRCTVQGPITTPYTERSQLSRSLALPAAVKILKENATEKMQSDFLKEIDLMKRVGENNNSHVVSMICCSTNQEPKALILEYVEYGDLLQYLQKNKVFVLKNKMKEEPIDSNKALPYLEPGDQYSHLAPRNMSSPYDHLRNILNDTDSVIEDPYPDLRQLLPVDMVTFAYQIADGMEYLSSLGIIHRDLACRNVLVGTNKILKISDFGLARQLSSDLVYYRSTEGKLPIRWMAPEAIKDRTFNTYTDIWSYGVTLWEIYTLGAFPYPLLSNRDVVRAVLNGERLENPPNCTEDLYEIMLDCWKADPELRPSFSFLKRKTEEIIQQANQAYPYLDFNLQDYLPYCNLRLTSEAVSTENILDDYKRGEDNEKESSGSETGEETKKIENVSSPTEV